MRGDALRGVLGSDRLWPGVVAEAGSGDTPVLIHLFLFI